jgi:hypothetical protein
MNKTHSINFGAPQDVPLVCTLAVLLLSCAYGQNCPVCSSVVRSAEPAIEDAWVIKKQLNNAIASTAPNLKRRV